MQEKETLDETINGVRRIISSMRIEFSIKNEHIEKGVNVKLSKLSLIDLIKGISRLKEEEIATIEKELKDYEKALSNGVWDETKEM